MAHYKLVWCPTTKCTLCLYHSHRSHLTPSLGPLLREGRVLRQGCGGSACRLQLGSSGLLDSCALGLVAILPVLLLAVLAAVGGLEAAATLFHHREYLAAVVALNYVGNPEREERSWTFVGLRIF